MKSKLTAIFFIVFICTSFAQKGKITGTVIDKDLQTAVAYATIAIKDGDQIVTGAMSDESGNFEVTVKNNKYVLEVQFIGYQTLQKNIELKESPLALGKLYLQPEATTLEGVNIVAERSTIEQKIDRKVINVGKDLTTIGATAGEIMNNVPSVNVDQDGKISLRGNDNVRILVDGRPTNISSDQLLKQIPATSIKKIELITNPSAKYNPEGMSGIINIVLHKNSMDGFNGSINTGFTIHDKIDNNNSVNLNYRKGKVNFFGNGNTNYKNAANRGDMYRFDQNSKQLIDGGYKTNSYLYKIGLDYYINDKNTLSAYTNQNTSLFDSNVATSNLYPENTFDNIYQSTFYDNKNRNSSYNLAYKHLFNDAGHNLDVEVNLNDSKSTNAGNYDTTIGNKKDLFEDYTEDKSTLTTVNIDYVNPINEKSKLEAGAEARISRTNNIANTANPSIPIAQRDINYDYDTNIFSAYVTFGQKFSKFSYQVGTRLESYKVESKLNGKKDFTDDYLTLYPSVYLGYDISESDMVQLSYSRRVDRPGIWQTRPIREFSTPTITSIGNPNLKPQFTNSVELNYTKIFAKGSSITGGVYYRRINDEINRVIIDDPNNDNPNAMIMTFDNFDSNNAYGFELSANLKITPWWDMQPAIDFSSIQQKGIVSKLNETTNVFDLVPREITASAFNARLSSNFKATQKLRFNLFGFYRGPVDGLTFNSKDMYKIDAGARYSLLNNKLTASLRVNDIFNTMKASFDGEYPYPQSGEFTWTSRTVYIGFNYTFGGGKNRAMQRKHREGNNQQNSGGGGLF
ncbi:outer membrane beta-barrel family protein [Myroides pelagicus]|uniref:TonB-dependent receptor n=1 Tax=Myroides pelagicus TaxID=270914 RepID=A0A7K1GL61_9FLAO|nr:outer membrane beta-barrel family protein [Myroides pelagicus]MEC4115122.1 outer membrane beta-barrel family protein [Myroides pelagicus]MTH29625.1 TonB-dependent receptor [Myroides pelagicus]